MSKSDIDKSDPWWDCPVCGELTEMTNRDGTEIGRHCTDCEWNYVYPWEREEES